jgi:hypothetical protein
MPSASGSTSTVPDLSPTANTFGGGVGLENGAAGRAAERFLLDGDATAVAWLKLPPVVSSPSSSWFAWFG